MSEQWFLERHGNLLGPYSLEQVRGLASAGQLRSTDKVMRDGDHQLLPLSTVPELAAAAVEPVPAQPLPDLQISQAPPIPRPPLAWRLRRVWIAGGITAGMIALAVLLLWPVHPDGEPDPASPDLPGWFHRRHRIRPAHGKRVVSLPGVGVLNPPANAPSPPSPFNRDWFETNFTHYLARDAFIYAQPRIAFESDGKLQAGIKVLLGEFAGPDAALVCICTETGRPINMYVRQERLRPRSQGPPAARKDD